MSEEMVCRKHRLSSFQIIILGFAGVILLGALLLMLPLSTTVQVRIDEVLPGAGAPVTHHGLLDVAPDERTLQQGVIQQIELAGGQIVGSTPIGVDLPEFLFAQGCLAAKAHTGSQCGHGNSSLQNKI